MSAARYRAGPAGFMRLTVVAMWLLAPAPVAAQSGLPSDIANVIRKQHDDDTREFRSFEEPKPLPKAGVAAVSPKARQASPSSFDCAKASAPVEKLICADAGLAGLDRTLTDAYTKAMAQWPDADKVKERANQRTWIASRDRCAKDKDMRACIESSYQRRLIEVQIRGGQLVAPTEVGFVCQGHEQQPFTAVYYNQTDPKSAVFTFGAKQTIAFAVRSASGARYASADVDFWEHQGEATVKWSGTTFTCRPR